MDLYIICAIWNSTKNNHAGMFHLAKKIKETYKDGNVYLIGIPTKQLGPLNFLYKIYNIYIGLKLRKRIRKEDILLLMEYFLPMCEQSYIAKLLYKKTKIIGIAHSIPATIDRLYSPKQLKKKASYLDHLLTLGSSLTEHFVNRGIPSSLITTTYHYVDNSFYYNKKDKCDNSSKKLQVICMGNMARDYDKLSKIVSRTPEINYYICKGHASIDSLFSEYSNIKLLGYISEDELKSYMHKSDVSLNLMKDTVGSNVITTSLSSGLAMICSNVGSIKDYISQNTGYLFTEIDEAVDILNMLNNNREKLYNAQECSLENARKIDINKFLTWFYSFIKQS